MAMKSRSNWGAFVLSSPYLLVVHGGQAQALVALFVRVALAMLENHNDDRLLFQKRCFDEEGSASLQTHYLVMLLLLLFVAGWKLFALRLVRLTPVDYYQFVKTQTSGKKQ